MPNQQDTLDLLFTALADANRRAMIDRLSKETLSVSQLADPLDISLPTAMQHLGVLEAAGLVTTKKVGRVRTCTLDRTALSRAEQWINDRRNLWEHRLDALGAFLEQPTPQLKRGDEE